MGSLEHGLEVLELLAARGTEKLVGVATELGVARATAHRLLSTLQSRGYVEHLPESHLYQLGPAVAELSFRSDLSRLPELAAPAMADLHALTGETINLAVLRRGRIVWSRSIDGRHAIRLTTVLGESVPAHATAIGKAVLAALPAEEWAGLLGPEPYHRFTPTTRTTLAALQADVDKARTAGYAIDDGESEVGGVCFASVILGLAGQPIGAISVAAVEARWPVDTAEQIGPAVHRWCKEISSRLSQGVRTVA
ncbi:transcriptional regulator, IclR family [Kribbella flavida DSM 17836]|uniref:Glycerol operon regulatory protein n=1 Tax=Kribbella flavida (strain DSM 17836 / JCM 10339 / NBRC 14399) TaxID=479435 RepID=D2PXV3_KRIFD|nr:IclR family transcriptional regulator [Kribbella flavida]ADB33559.1 transcriptional regulator, IclR family [Kribbella flavida DSM 17836]